MPGKKDNKRKKKEKWRQHNCYNLGVSSNRIVTRSQGVFCQLKNSESDLELFADKSRHHPPGLPHLMEVLVGTYGAIPNTIITRSTGKHLGKNEALIKILEEYKNYSPGQSKED